MAGNISRRPGHVYVLRDPASGMFYVGSTSMLRKRLEAHRRWEHPAWVLEWTVGPMPLDRARALEHVLIAALADAGYSLANQPNPASLQRPL